MSFLETGEGLCQRPGLDHPLIWDGRFEREKTEDMVERHERARIACRRCPAFEECEERLQHFEARKKPVDGVMAGRYCDVYRHPTTNEPYQAECAACGQPMTPRAETRRKKRLVHIGYGLCNLCYPNLKPKKATP